jgi:c-di-GMP-binding flagellar brake protein YcgR
MADHGSNGSVIQFMEASDRTIFEQSVDERWAAAASVCHEEQMHIFEARLTHRGDETFSFEAQSWPTSLPAGESAAGLPVVLEFGIDGRCIKFEAEVRAIELKQGEAGTSVAIVRCDEPSTVAVLQRRQNFRTPVPAGAPLAIVAWKVPPHWVLRDKPKPSAQLKVDMVDLSTGGMCLNILPHRVGPESVAKDDRIRIELKFEDSEAILDAQVVYRAEPAADQSVRVGLAFRKLENNIEGRRGLFLVNRAIGALQRLTIKEKEKESESAAA